MRVKQQRILYEYLSLRLPFPWKQTGMGLRGETREGLANLAELGAGAPSRWSRRHPLARTVLDVNALRRDLSIKALGRTTAVLLTPLATLSPQKTVGTLMHSKCEYRVQISGLSCEANPVRALIRGASSKTVVDGKSVPRIECAGARWWDLRSALGAGHRASGSRR
jgi:hypothetical protein